MNKSLLLMIIAALMFAGSAFTTSRATDPYPPSSIELYSQQTPKLPPGFNYGWPINGTLMLIHSSLIRRLTSILAPQFIVRTLWDAIPKH